MAITKLTTPELLDFPNNSTSSANTSGTVIPTGTTAINVDYLVVAGGGAGGSYIAGGGGAGGLRTSYGNTSGGGSPSESTLILNTATNYTITIGAGGSTASPYGNNGDDSIFATITSTGGGGGGGRLGLEGGSGGGSQYGDGHVTGYGNDIRIAGIKNQGYSGSAGDTSGSTYGGGGGGAGGPGTVGTGACTSQQGGGPGLSVSITGVAVTYASGGDGGGNDGTPCTVNGGSNTGDGGSGSNQGTGAGTGGSGIIVLRVASTVTATFSAGVTSTLTQVGGGAWSSGDKIYTITVTSGSETVSFTTTAANIRPTTSLNTGEFRYNTTQGYVEYYNGSNWKQIVDEYITGQPSTCVCNFPTTAANLWEFNDDVTDTCGNNNGTAVNPAYGTGKFGKAYDFSANTSSYSSVTSSFITFADDMSRANDFSWSFWIKSTGTLSSYPTIISFYGTYVNYIYFSPNIGAIYLAFSDGADQSFSTGLSSLSNWTHFAWTKSSTSGRVFYIDGTVVFSDATTADSGAAPRTGSAIGMHWNTLSTWQYPLNGDTLIDQFRLFPSALTATQVTELSNEVVCT
jgi:hypothetical protein